jgi:hypothetical protein
MVGAAGVLALLLASCGMGRTGEAIDVGHASAILTGEADRTEPGAITYWFEYGETTDYGSTTPVQGATVSTWIPVQAEVDGLAPTTTYHYRLCVDDDQGEGSCGEDHTFTTTAADTVSGSVIYQPSGPWPTLGIHLDVRSDPDGGHPAGSVGIYLPDPGGMRSYEPTCVRVEGTRAAIGYVGVSWSGSSGPAVVYVRSGTPLTYALVPVDEVPTSCPDPWSVELSASPGTGVFTVVDAP